MSRQNSAVDNRETLLARLKGTIRRSLRYLRLRMKPATTPRRSLRPTVSQVTEFAISEHLFMEVYWLSFNHHEGPAASVYAHHDEVMRFDCLGAEAGHFHINMWQSSLLPGGGSARIYLSMDAVCDQIREAGFWLRRNLAYSLTTNRSPKIRAVRVDRRKLDTAAEKMMELMTELADMNGTLSAG